MTTINVHEEEIPNIIHLSFVELREHHYEWRSVKGFRGTNTPCDEGKRMYQQLLLHREEGCATVPTGNFSHSGKDFARISEDNRSRVYDLHMLYG